MTLTERRFYGILKEDNTDVEDVGRLQLFYLLARTDELWRVFARIYDLETHCVKEGWEKLVGGKIGKMLGRAMHLYNRCNKDVSTVDIFEGLDSWNIETMVNAQMIYLSIGTIIIPYNK